MNKLTANYEAWICNEFTGEIVKLTSFSKQHITKKTIKMLTYSCGFPYECKTRLGDEKDISFIIWEKDLVGDIDNVVFINKDLNVYLKEINKYLIK